MQVDLDFNKETDNADYDRKLAEVERRKIDVLRQVVEGGGEGVNHSGIGIWKRGQSDVLNEVVNVESFDLDSDEQLDLNNGRFLSAGCHECK